MNTTAVRRFTNREDAGLCLAGRLAKHVRGGNPVLLALPRGGVPVAAAIATTFGLPFEVLNVRKLGVPGHEEFAMGAIAAGGVIVLDHQVVAECGLDFEDVGKVVRCESRELGRREHLYCGNRSRPNVTHRKVILVDDGMATGSTMSAAIRFLRHQQAGYIVVAVPVSPRDTARRLREEADEVVTVLEPRKFIAVGRWYDDFSQTSDDEVRRLLDGQHACVPASV